VELGRHITKYRVLARALLFWVLVAELARGVDLAVSNIEVTQAIQTTTNSIQLVAKRGTAVRATIVNLDGGPVSGVTGNLHVFVNGSEITPVGGVPPINAPFTVPASPQRANENDTLNFELPAPTGITASTNVTFRVDVTPVPGETNTANNSLTTSALTAINRTTPSLYFTRVNWTPSGLGLPALSDVQPGVGDAFVRGIYPVNDGDPNLYRQGLFPTLTFTEDPDGNGVLDQSPEGNDLLSFLASCRQLIVNNGLGANNDTFLYGWIAGNPINGNGLSVVSGFVGFGNTQQTRYQRTYAHELGHQFGLGHNSRTLDQVGWDVGARLPNNPAGNNTSGRVKSTALNDVMVPAQLTNAAWVDTITYNFLLGSSILSDAPDIGEKLSDRVLVIQGIFDPEGKELIYLKPVFRFPWRSQPTSRRQEGRFAVEVTDVAGSVTRVRFDPRVSEDLGPEAEKVKYGFFEVMIAVSPERDIASMRITNAAGWRDYAVVKPSKPSKPSEIVIVAPREREQLGSETKVVWRVEDSDVDRLLYQVAYSPDAGRNWVPIAVDVPGTTNSIVFDSTEIQRSKGEGIIRVFVSDGLNTVFADVSKLTTVVARYREPAEPLHPFSPQAELEHSVILWDQAALQAVRTTRPGPPIVARDLAIVHTAMFDAWAAYDPVAVGTRLGGKLRRPDEERTLENKAKAVSFAAYRALVDLFRSEKPSFDSLMTTLGYDPADTSTDIATPSGIGNVACTALLEFRHHDGSNQLGELHPGPYSDYTGYKPVNTPDMVNDPNHWQPLRVSDGGGGFVVQQCIAPFWGRVTPFALKSGSQFRPDPPEPFGSEGYVQQAREILAYSAGLTDTQKVIAEYWADGPSSELPPGHWALFAQFVSLRDKHGLDDDVKMFFAITNAMLDASIVAWDAKRFYDSVRPVTAIHLLYRGQVITAWAGPNKGTALIPGETWQPYQAITVVTPPFPEYISGHSIFSAAGATVLRLFTGSDVFGASCTIKAGTSRFEPGVVPKSDLTLSWATFTDAANEAGISRRYGGIHFVEGDLVARDLGRKVGQRAWKKALTYFNPRKREED
jgi:hypothetical protein